jgi:coatomer subunit beta'
LLFALLIYQTAIVRRDFEGSKKSLLAIPEDQHNRLARLLKSQDLKQLALEISKDPDHSFG